jgi:hypothetical protein
MPKPGWEQRNQVQSAENHTPILIFLSMHKYYVYLILHNYLGLAEKGYRTNIEAKRLEKSSVHHSIFRFTQKNHTKVQDF